MMDSEKLLLMDLQPSQFYISKKKLDAVRAWFNPADLSNFEPLPVKKLDGKVILTDGHTRAWAAYCAGLERVPLVWDTDDWLDWGAYQVDIRACERRDVHSVADFAGRVIPEDAYISQWNGWCDRMQEALAVYREQRGMCESDALTDEDCKALLNRINDCL